MDVTFRRGSRRPQGTKQRADYSMLGAVMQSQAGDGEPSGGHRGIESTGADDLAAVALDAQRDTSTSTVGLGVDAVARTAAYLRLPFLQNALEPVDRSLMLRTPW